MSDSASVFARFYGQEFIGATAMLVVASPFLFQACSPLKVAHSGDNPTYELKGKHATTPCEACHGPGKPGTLPTVCIDCHDADRPNPQHNAGRNCFPCHTEEGWDVGVTPTTDTGLPLPTGDTGTTYPTTQFDHRALPLDKACWDCHELAAQIPPETVGGAERKNDTHYTALTGSGGPDADHAAWWDCGSCHNYTAPWDEDYIVHPSRTPHGSLQSPDTTTWVIACADCHQDETDYTLFDCETCHLAKDPAFYPHFGDAQAPGPLANESCQVCHPHGDDTQ